jgi:2-methylisocitrate lyase-like PEP mutase family enzyme
VPELARVGVRRVSTGSLLASAAYGTLLAGARELLSAGTSTYTERGMKPADRDAALS